MSVVAAIAVEYRRFNGYEDPALPIGIWIARAEVIGDASAGTSRIQFNFSTAGTPLSAQFYSLEQMYYEGEGGSTRNVILDTVGLEIVNLFNMITRMHFTYRGAGALGGAIDAKDFASLRGLYLGVTAAAGITSALRLTNEVNTNLESFSAGAQGYYWSPRSVLVDGGPQRPLTGLFPS